MKSIMSILLFGASLLSTAGQDADAPKQLTHTDLSSMESSVSEVILRAGTIVATVQGKNYLLPVEARESLRAQNNSYGPLTGIELHFPGRKVCYIDYAELPKLLKALDFMAEDHQNLAKLPVRDAIYRTTGGLVITKGSSGSSLAYDGQTCMLDDLTEFRGAIQKGQDLLKKLFVEE